MKFKTSLAVLSVLSFAHFAPAADRVIIGNVSRTVERGASLKIIGGPVLDELEPRNPEAKGQDPKRFFDNRFVRALPGNRFIDGFY